MIPALANYEWYWWLQLSIFALGGAILLSLCIVHLVNIISDLCTSKRRSIKKNPIKPELNWIYLSIILLSIISMILFTFSTCNTLIWIWRYTNCMYSIETIKWFTLIATICWLLAKQSMYLLFLFRLHVTYKTSVYQYDTKILIIIAIITSFWTFGCCINVLLFTEIEIKYYKYISFAVHYNRYYPFWGVLMSGFLDIVLSMTFIYLFINPLNKIVNQMCFKNGENMESIFELYSIGVKALILTSICIMTTFIFLIFVFLTKTLLLLPIDAIINSFCIMMITPYYPDHKYYKKICFLPIKYSKKWKINQIKVIKPLIIEQINITTN